MASGPAPAFSFLEAAARCACRARAPTAYCYLLLVYIYKHTPILYIYISNRFFFIWFVCKSLGVDAMDGSMFVRKHVLDGAGLVIFFSLFF